MKKLTFLLLIICLPLTAQEYYRSNSLAMELEKLEEGVTPGDPESGWILEKRKNGNLYDFTLYDNGSVDRSFVREYGTMGSLIYSSESRNGKLSEEVFYRADGQIAEETFYRNDGTVDEVKTYRYSEEGSPLGVELRNGDTGPAALDYSIRSDGSLRSVERTGNGDSEIRSSINSFRGSLFMEEHVNDTVREISYHSGSGRLLSLIRYEDGKIIEEEEREYSGQGILSKVVSRNLKESTETIQTMNASGAVLKEEFFLEGQLQWGQYYSYSSGKMVAKEKKGSGVMERWTYAYREDDLAVEEYYDKGDLEQKKVFSGDDRSTYILELFDRGEIFMKVYYEDDVKMREEFITGGKVTRTRELGGE